MVSVLTATAVAGGTLVGCGGASASPPQRVADQLAQTDSALRSTIDDWRAGGDPPEVAPPQDVLDQA